MYQTLSALFQKNPYLYLVVGAAVLLLGMAVFVAIRNSRNKAAAKTKREQTKMHLTDKAAELLAVCAVSPLADRKQLGQRLEHFRALAVKLGMDSNDFIALTQQATMREIAFATRNEFELGDAPHAPHEPILAVFAPTPSEFAKLVGVGRTDDTERNACESVPMDVSDGETQDDTTQFDRASLVDDNAPTSVFERNKLILSAADESFDTEVARAVDNATSVVDHSESGQVLFFPEDDTDLAATRVDC